jgi:hypothetical protein
VYTAIQQIVFWLNENLSGREADFASIEMIQGTSEKHLQKASSSD